MTAPPAPATEAVRFARYLLGVEPAAELVERYVRADATLFGPSDPPSDADRAVLALAAARPWTLPLLDAGTAVVPGAPRLRHKLLVMMAILETTPAHAARTAQVDGGIARPRLALALARHGLTAACKLVAGVALTAVVTARARTRGGDGAGE